MTSTTQEAHFRLLILGDGSVRTLPLTGDRWTIGRSLDCTITLRDPTASRRHLLLERTGDTFRFQDLGGANPALLDGRPVRQGVLLPGQQLTIGLTRMVLEERRRPAPVATSQNHTVVLGREVIDDELTQEGDPSSFTRAAARVLQSIEWTFADLGDLADAAEPLLELALNLTGRRTGWLARLLTPTGIETLAAIHATGESFVPTLPESALEDARRISAPHVLRTREDDVEVERLLVPLGDDGAGLLVLQDPQDHAPDGQELLRLARSLGKVVWHRLQETMERIRLRDELERLRFHGTEAHNALLASVRLQAARERARSRAADRGAVVLVGEPGTEHEDLARFLHAESAQRAEPFVVWDASQLARRPAAELVGEGDRIGAVDRAQGGTLFVDDAQLLPADHQRRLAAAIASERCDVRLILATDQAETKWTTELAELLNDPPLRLPPLRDDTRDVLVLAELFLSGLGTCPDGSPRLITERAKRLLTTHTWPGNVRELRLTLESAAARAGNQPIAPRHLPLESANDAAGETARLPTLEEVERHHIQEVLRHTGGVRARAAQALGIATSTLYEKLKRYGIES
ncbi:MAG: sigma 54-interacting transcriptional regulator [Planctomycetes bacterium]|nr:sigma 54-interacting transcriptional regulator [Planctomycetota bacterium]